MPTRHPTRRIVAGVGCGRFTWQVRQCHEISPSLKMYPQRRGPACLLERKGRRGARGSSDIPMPAASLAGRSGATSARLRALAMWSGGIPSIRSEASAPRSSSHISQRVESSSSSPPLAAIRGGGGEDVWGPAGGGEGGGGRKERGRE